MRLRRVVAGVGGDGRATVLTDSLMKDPMTQAHIEGWELHALWATNSSSAVPVTELLAPVTPRAPGVGETQFTIWQLPPVTAGANPAGMHKTSSVDYIVILSGAVTLVLDNEQELTLEQGDCLVQGGNAHEWINRGDEPCVLAVVVVGCRAA